MTGATATLDLVERTSYVSTSNVSRRPSGSEHGRFESMKTPNDVKANELESGALREGGAPNLLSKESLGLLSQYAAVGLIYGTMPNLITPFLTYYLNMEGTATTSARALLSIPWSMKVFIGILSDCVPIFGFRRRPYMVLGWLVTAACLLIMALLPLPEPYFPDPDWRSKKPTEYSDIMKEQINKSAPDEGGKYIVLMMMATLGYLLADVAADGVLVEYAQREPEETRGRTQTAIYATRTLFGVFAQVIIGFGLSSAEYGGEFDFGISVRTAMLILAAFCIPIIPMTWCFIAEKTVIAPSFRAYLNNLWDAIQSRAVYQVIAYSFLSNVLGGFSYVASDPITSYWVHASAFNLSISGVIGSGVMTITLLLTGKYGLHWDWRTMQVVTCFFIIAVDCACTMLVTWDVVRSPWFWLGLPIVEYVPLGVSFIISTYVVVELAGEGNEGAIYGLMTTVSNLGGPFALTLTKNMNSPFKVYNDDILEDTHEVRRDVTITIFLSYVMKILALACLPLLPRQKAETQELKRTGGTSKLMGMFTVAYLLFALCWSILTNLFSIFESTKCLKITGGCKY